ncbi:MAG: 2-oxoacid:ferredoxin oxidoreductase subunit gamma [Candidatus Mcinerneyibacterium aminivorans]|uniref:2-oxoacid:ferredoxin oxidoreductase subunit gamma n=1 Tax=Candidatus Mcinerneyibacterium aminivorans TaxID=2703815 RepID=A0A5D0MGM5_9BACT|nr:MAG: 2-oxoacid:ferredoxin oxidoreductase subunit gamma [Candidatus Mcinerneyibacterium aminivorans]
MEHRIIMAGFGGQGIMVMGSMLTYAAMKEGKETSWIPSYGVEQRGGTANCSVVVSDEIIAAPIVDNPDMAIIMNRPSLDKFEPRMVKNGLLLINDSIVEREVERDDLEVIRIKANDIAIELGNKRIANMVMLGALTKKTGIVKIETLKNSLKDVLSKRRHDLIGINQKALDKGADLV